MIPGSFWGELIEVVLGEDACKLGVFFWDSFWELGEVSLSIE
jgi:hypothetical protein